MPSTNLQHVRDALRVERRRQADLASVDVPFCDLVSAILEQCDLVEAVAKIVEAGHTGDELARRVRELW